MLPFSLAMNPPALTTRQYETQDQPACWAAGMIDGPQMGFIPFSTVIPLGGGFVTSPPILCAGLNAFALNFLSTNVSIQGFAMPCQPDTGVDLFGGSLGNAAFNGFQIFDETAGIPLPYRFGAAGANAAAQGAVWHIFRLVFFNPDVANDAQIQFCELYANARLSV